MIVVLLLLSCLILPDMKAFVVLFALPFSASLRSEEVLEI